MYGKVFKIGKVASNEENCLESNEDCVKFADESFFKGMKKVCEN